MIINFLIIIQGSMKKVSLFIAMSLDGYIADSEGSVEWLVGQGDDADNIDTYSEFAKDIDTVIMGGILIIKLLLNFRQMNGFIMILQPM